MNSKIFYEQLETISASRRLEVADVKESIVTALEKAFQADGHLGIVEVVFDDENKKVRVYENYKVVETSEDENYKYPLGEVTLEQALQIKSRVKLGSEFRVARDFKDIGRKGAARFKQIFVQSLRAHEIERAYAYFTENIGEVITAEVDKVTENAVILHVGYNVTSYMPVEDGLQGEEYTEGKKIPVCITKVEETSKGPKVFVTRSQKEIIKRLFETFIPEVMDGTVELMYIARDPGYRTKVCVKSNNVNVDAKGACLGINGARIKQINTALNGERIDLFSYNENPALLIKEALTPATVIGVLVNNETHKAIAIVSDNEFSLAIGKGGQNVRLASQACGWKIDIKDETTALRDEIKFERF